ncbi:MAG TPA: IS1595 family transposase [Bryobacteraceae bacterium]|nr:IS1595 family transposase [Bryobacteraceae bacterium]
MDSKTSLLQAIQYFADFEHCRQFMVELRWPDGVVKCPHCGSEKVTWLAKARVWKCYGNHPQPRFSLKTGTIFEDSPIALEKWLPAAWLLINCKNGISSYELHRDLKVTQKTAWFMLHRIRLAMQSKTFNKLMGEIEVDETFIGGKARFMHADKRAEHIHGRGPEGKAIVAAVLERGGTIRAQVCDSRRKPELQKMVRENVEAGSNVYTDALKSYEGLDPEFTHKVIDHAEAYVDGQVHTNGCENFWSLLKRALKGTYVSVEPYHLFRYIDEEVYRYNNRSMTDAERFTWAMRHIVGRRVTYKQLTGKIEADLEMEGISHG